MTENEAIKELRKLRPNGGIIPQKRAEMMDVAIKALEEIQEYRAIGTVKGYERAIQSSIENYNLYKEYKTKVQAFESIGTIEEFKALKEKNVAKKVVVKKSETIELDICDEKGNVHLCPTCNDYIICSDVKHCWNCGQALET